jgi:hypothetical protein
VGGSLGHQPVEEEQRLVEAVALVLEEIRLLHLPWDALEAFHSHAEVASCQKETSSAEQHRQASSSVAGTA